MRKAKQLDACVFLYSMWANEFDTPNTMMGEMVMSAIGTHIAYQATIETPYITLVSRENGWLDQTNVDDIKALYNQVGATFLLTYSDDSTVSVRFAHEKGITFNPTHEGSCYYYATINLAKVV